MVQSCRTETHIQIYLSKQSLLNIFLIEVDLFQLYSKVIQLCVCVCVCVSIYILFQILFHYRLLQDTEKVLRMLYQYTLWSFGGGKIEELYNWRFMQQMRNLFF